MLPARFWLDANHFLFAVAIVIVGLVALLWELRRWISDHGEGRTVLGRLTALVLILALAVTGVTGVLIFLKVPGLEAVTRISYSVFDAAILVARLAATVSVLHRVVQQFGNGSGRPEHHPGG